MLCTFLPPVVGAVFALTGAGGWIQVGAGLGLAGPLGFRIHFDDIELGRRGALAVTAMPQKGKRGAVAAGHGSGQRDRSRDGSAVVCNDMKGQNCSRWSRALSSSELLFSYREVDSD